MLNFSFMKLGRGGSLSKKLSFSRLLIVTNSNNSSLPISNFKIWRNNMNMTSNGIGWGVTQNYPNYDGSTISVPVGCIVIVTKGHYSSSQPTVKFNGTFALISLRFSVSIYGSSYTIVGSSIPLLNIYQEPADNYQFFGGAFIRLS